MVSTPRRAGWTAAQGQSLGEPRLVHQGVQRHPRGGVTRCGSADGWGRSEVWRVLIGVIGAVKAVDGGSCGRSRGVSRCVQAVCRWGVERRDVGMARRAFTGRSRQRCLLSTSASSHTQVVHTRPQRGGDNAVSGAWTCHSGVFVHRLVHTTWTASGLRCGLLTEPSGCRCGQPAPSAPRAAVSVSGPGT